MVLIHPVIQSATLLLMLYVFWLGLQRFASRHLGVKRVFHWKTHVLFGQVVTLVMMGGALGGLFITRLTWKDYLITGNHGAYGLALSAILAGSLITGLIMDGRKKKRSILPLIHAALGLSAVLMGIYQLRTGIWVLNNYTHYQLF